MICIKVYMHIIIKPTQIIQMCLWDKFEYYVLSKETDIKEFIKEDKELELTEKDALVIGLLKCVQTDNLVHRLNDYIDSFMNNKSSKIEDVFKVKKKNLIQTVSEFKNKFPETWEPSKDYKQPLKDLFLYIDDLIIKFEGLQPEVIKEKTGTFEYVNCNSIKKNLKYHN